MSPDVATPPGAGTTRRRWRLALTLTGCALAAATLAGCTVNLPAYPAAPAVAPLAAAPAAVVPTASTPVPAAVAPVSSATVTKAAALSDTIDARTAYALCRAALTAQVSAADTITMNSYDEAFIGVRADGRQFLLVDVNVVPTVDAPADTLVFAGVGAGTCTVGGTLSEPLVDAHLTFGGLVEHATVNPNAAPTTPEPQTKD